ncbi:ADOP family duplicated permease [Oleiharenicola lentus]|uniref:ABC transporter permease n=1 Tax=Oleiharenicola lentus TaxID=2508720 RepID=UPI003F665428
MKILRKLRSLVRKEKIESEMTEEMRLHIELQTELNLKSGLAPDEARYAALRQFGNVVCVQENAREGRGWLWLENLARDLRLGVRSLLKTPGFTLIAVVTIAFAVGANTAMFSVFNEIVLRPLPFPKVDQLERIFRVTPQNDEGLFSSADYLDLQSKAAGYGQVAAYTPANLSVAEPGRPAEIAGALRVEANFFSVLGVQPQLGRSFRADEAVLGNHRVVVISHRYWQNRFGGDAKIIGHTFRINGEPHEIIGVMPPAFSDWRYLGWVDVFRPLGLSSQEAADRDATPLRFVARRAETLSPADASAFIRNFGEKLAADFPASNVGSSWRTLPLESTAQSSLVTVSMLITLSGFVLLIACSNLANFLLARTMARAREFAVRAALGASRFQLMLPLAVESLLLAITGGIGAVLVATWATDWLTARSVADDGRFVTFPLDWTVLGWALFASLGTALAFGIAPALFAMRLNVNSTLKSGARGATAGRAQQRFGRMLIAGQFALAMVLLTGAAVFVRGIHEVNNRRTGWESDHLVTGSVLLPVTTYQGPEQINAFHRLAVERLETLPGVTSASVSSVLPFFGLSAPRRYLVQGHPVTPEPGREPAAAVNAVSPRYFETVGTGVVRGRAFNAGDTLRSPKVFVINEAMAKGLFGGGDPVGQRLAQVGGPTLEWGEIVGVARDVQSVIPNSKPVSYQVYQPITQEPEAFCEIAVRAPRVDPATLVSSIRATIAALNPDLPVTLLRPANLTITRTNYELAVLRDMLASIAILGLALASLGVYGVIARTVAQRTSEFGIRIALGARTRDITRNVLSSGVKLALIGSSLGLLGAYGITQLIAAGYPGMPTHSVAVLLGVTLLLLSIAFLACWLPARRAAKVDPMIALRAE